MKTLLLALPFLLPACTSQPVALQWGWGSSPQQVAAEVQHQGWEPLRPLRKKEKAGHLSQMSFRLPQLLRGNESIRTYIFRDNMLVRVYLLTRGTGAQKTMVLFNTSYRQLAPTVWVDPQNGTRVHQAWVDNNQVFTVSPG